MKPGVTLSVLLVTAFAAAGCVEAEVPLETADDASEMAVDESLRIDAKNCRQGGGNSVYAMEDGQTKVGPFYAEDQNPEVGDPMIGAYGRPVAGPSNGIWHVATVCESYTYMGKEHSDLGMGWIAQMIKRPDFDTWGEPRIQFIVADLSFNNEEFVHALGEATGGAEVSPAFETTIEWVAPENKYMHVVISEANHGTFDFTAEIHKEFARKETEHIRFWMLPSTDGSHHHDHAESAEEPKFRPVSIDIFDTVEGEGTMKLAGESAGTFTHIQDMNDPTSNHVGNPLGHYQDGFDRTIVIGPAPEDVFYDETWLH